MAAALLLDVYIPLCQDWSNIIAGDLDGLSDRYFIFAKPQVRYTSSYYSRELHTLSFADVRP